MVWRNRLLRNVPFLGENNQNTSQRWKPICYRNNFSRFHFNSRQQHKWLVIFFIHGHVWNRLRNVAEQTVTYGATLDTKVCQLFNRWLFFFVYSGFLPTFGPAWLNLYGNYRDNSEESLLNCGVGEGLAYRGSVKLSLHVQLLDDFPKKGLNLVEIRNVQQNQTTVNKFVQFFWAVPSNLFFRWIWCL